MKSFVKYVLCLIGILAMITGAYMLPALFARISGTWAFFSSQVESKNNTITAGTWDVSEEDLTLENQLEFKIDSVQENPQDPQTETPLNPELQTEGNDDAESETTAK